MRQPGSRTTTSPSASARGSPDRATARNVTVAPGASSASKMTGTSTTTPSGRPGAAVKRAGAASPASRPGAQAGPFALPARSGARDPRQGSVQARPSPVSATSASAAEVASATTTRTT